MRDVIHIGYHLTPSEPCVCCLPDPWWHAQDRIAAWVNTDGKTYNSAPEPGEEGPDGALGDGDHHPGSDEGPDGSSSEGDDVRCFNFSCTLSSNLLYSFCLAAGPAPIGIYDLEPPRLLLVHVS